MTASILTFTYFILATPFITWAVFRYNELNAHKVYVKALEEDIVVVKEKMQAITENMEKLLTEFNSIKLKAGLSGKEKRLFK